MNFKRPDYEDDLRSLRASRHSARRAQADNFLFEENVSDTRRDHFEGYPSIVPGLLGAATAYYLGSVQGARRGHLPSTFESMNASAFCPDISPVQKILRLERIDEVLSRVDWLRTDRYERLKLAVSSSPRLDAQILPLVDGLNDYPGERPAFFCFKSEVSSDLGRPDWLSTMIERLGLGHWVLAPGQTGHFALMEYQAADVIASAAPRTPFAVPTVLDAQNSAHFFPAPAGAGEGLAVDLNPVCARVSVRELLHARIQYRTEHVVRLGELIGPTPKRSLPEIRDQHLRQVRERCGAPNYGTFMSGEVDPD